VRLSVGITIAASLCLLMAAPASASAAPPASPCPGGRIATASGCTSLAAAGRHVDAIANRAVQDNDLRAVLLRIDVGDRTLTRISAGESMPGVPATRRMHFRIGAIAIPYLIDLLLQLQDKRKLSLDDPVSTWFPDLPNADRVTLRMLASATSGYPDWVQGNPAFVDALYDDVFRQWRTQDLVDVAFAQPPACEPGACFHYAHTNFVILDRVIHKVTGQSVARLMRARVLRPLGLRQTDISALPRIPAPVLHAYTADRGPYEDSTFWSPSWSIAKSTIMTSTIGDVIKSAKAIGTGALISPQASRERFAPPSVGFPGFGQEDLYYGLGAAVTHAWEFQNPQLNGYTAIMAYLPPSRIALALTVTKGKRAAATSTNFSALLWKQIAEYLTPSNPVKLPGL
jgi:D-alanyl-D-alanine carboxypeptidase